jgi:hypothetical protein
MAHADHAWVRTTVERVRLVSRRMKKELAVMMDIKGPEIRTGARKEATQLTVGQVVDVTGSDTALADGEILVIPTNYPKMITAVPVGGVVLVDNGLIQLRVLEQKKDRLRCKVEQPGPLGSRRHINLPGVKVDLPALTDASVPLTRLQRARILFAGLRSDGETVEERAVGSRLAIACSAAAWLFHGARITNHDDDALLAAFRSVTSDLTLEPAVREMVCSAERKLVRGTG